MDDTLLMGVMSGASQRFQPGGGLARRLRSAGQAAGQIASGGELQREKRPGHAVADVVFAHFIDAHDVGVTQARHRFRLDAKARPFLRGHERAAEEHFQGHRPLQLLMAGLVDDAHTAAADFLKDFVVADSLRRRGRLAQRTRQRRLTIGGHGRIGHRIEGASRRLAARTTLQVFRQFVQDRFRQIAQVEGRQFFRRQATLPRHVLFPGLGVRRDDFYIAPGLPGVWPYPRQAGGYIVELLVL